MESYSSDASVILNINYSSRTSSLDFQRTMEDNISKRTGRIFGPEQGKKLRIFIDDLSMPKIDLYGTQQPLALLKFLMERMFMYECGGDLDKIIIQDCQFVSGMQPPGAGRNTIDPAWCLCMPASELPSRPAIPWNESTRPSSRTASSASTMQCRRPACSCLRSR